jgi:hypothetical protein
MSFQSNTTYIFFYSEREATCFGLIYNPSSVNVEDKQQESRNDISIGVHQLCFISVRWT